MQEAGFEEIRKAITRRQNTVAQYIATRPIMDLYERATQRRGARVSRRWWEKERIELEAAKERAADSTATNSESEAESEEGWGGISASSGVSGSNGAEQSEEPWRTKRQTNGTLRKFTKSQIIQ